MISEFVRRVDGFERLRQIEQIEVFAWYLQAHGGKSSFSASEIAGCFDAADMLRPANVSMRLTELVGNKRMIRTEKSKYKQPLHVKKHFDGRYGSRPETVAVDALLCGLPAKLSTSAESAYLTEALLCFRNQAFRGAIIMTWNVCYHHLEQFIVDQHLVAFNAQALQNGKKAKDQITVLDDFQRWKESDMIEVSKAAGIVSREVGKVLVDGLNKRNSAAHPSGSTFDKLQTEAYISDLVQNAMLKLA